jgi:hypothetical protein
MNTRIREMTRQIYGPSLLDHENFVMNNDKMERFVELLIKACVDKIQGLRMVENDETDIEERYWRYWNAALGHAVLEIEQQFLDDKDEQC